MRALRLHETNGPESLVVEEIDEPQAADGFVLVDVHAAGIGFVDLLTTRGEYQIKPPLPFTPASECAGTRRDTGERVVAMSMFSSLAEVAPALGFAVFPMPDAMTYEQGVAMLINYQTAHLALVTRGRLAEGESVLVHGAAGGVGTAAIQVAKALGASQVIAAASTPEKREAAIGAGASDAIDPYADGWTDTLKELTGGRGVDVIVDPVGGDLFNPSLRCLAPFGRMLVVGFAAGAIPEVKVNYLLLKHLDVIGVNWGGMLPLDTQFAHAAHADLVRWFAAGLIDPVLGPVYDLEDGAQAFRDLDSRKVTGKPVIRVRG
jgi:NADPH2:quinone reductase